MLIVLEMSVMKLSKEVFKQLGTNSFLYFFTGDDECSSYTGRSRQGLLTITYSRTVNQSWLKLVYEKLPTG